MKCVIQVFLYVFTAILVFQPAGASAQSIRDFASVDVKACVYAQFAATIEEAAESFSDFPEETVELLVRSCQELEAADVQFNDLETRILVLELLEELQKTFSQE